MVKGMTLLLLGATLACMGCEGKFDLFNRNKDLPDPQAPVRIVQKFCQDNPAASTSVELTMLVREQHTVGLSAEAQAQLLTALRDDCRPLKSGQDVANIRGISHMPLARITLNGPDYALTVYLDSFGLALGNGGGHRFTSPAMAEALHRCFKEQGLMSGPLGQSLSTALKKAAGTISLYQPLPPATDGEDSPRP